MSLTYQDLGTLAVLAILIEKDRPFGVRFPDVVDASCADAGAVTVSMQKLKQAGMIDFNQHKGYSLYTQGLVALSDFVADRKAGRLPLSIACTNATCFAVEGGACREKDGSYTEGFHAERKPKRKRTRAKRASYREGVEWIALMDGPADDDALDPEHVGGCTSVLLLAALFGKPALEVGEDIVAFRKKHKETK